MMKRQAKTVLGVVSAVGLAWWLIFGVWLPWRVEASIREYFDDSEISLEDIDLTWGSGSVSGLQVTGKTFDAWVPEARFTYSPLQWIFGRASKLRQLVVAGMKVRGGEDVGETFWEWLEDRRMDEDLSALDTLSVEGEALFMGEAFPFRVRSVAPDFAGSAKLSFSVEGNATLPFFGRSFVIEDKWEGEFYWERMGNGATTELRFGITLVEVGEVNLWSTPSDEGFSVVCEKREAPLFSASMKRVRGEERFAGEWNATVVTADLVRRWPLLALFAVEASMGGDLTWIPAGNFVEAGVAGVAEVSSFLFRDAGVVKAELTGGLTVDENGTLTLEDLALVVADQLGERLEVRVMNPWQVGREKALLRTVVDGFRLGRFSSRLPSEVAVSGEIETELDAEGALIRLGRITLLREGEDWAIISGVGEVSFTDGEGALVSFSLECEPGIALLGEVFPEGGFGEVFGKPGARGRAKLTGGWSGGALKVATFDGNLATTMGERNLTWRSLGPVRVLFRGGEPSLAPAVEEDADVFEMSAKSLPLDGLLNWRGGGVQGDLSEVNGTVFFEEGRLGFRCGEVEVENGRALQGSKVVAENLNLRAALRFLSHPGGGGELTLAGLRLVDGGVETVRGDLVLSLGPNGHVVGGVSTELEADPTRFDRLGLRSFPNLISGKLRARNLKVSTVEKFALELDVGFEGVGTSEVAGGEERDLSGGLRLTVEEGEAGKSVWMGLHLNGEPGSTHLEMDLVPGSKAVTVSAEEISVTDLAFFLRTFAPSDKGGKSRRPDALLRRLSERWRVDCRTLRLAVMSPLANLVGEMNVSVPGAIDWNATGELMGGVATLAGHLVWVDDNVSEVRLENLRMSIRDLNASVAKTVSSLAGPFSVDANGTYSPSTGFLGEANASSRGCELTFFPEGNATARFEVWRRGLARSLGVEPVLPADKAEVLRVLAGLPGKLRFEDARLRARRIPDGKIEVVELTLSEDELLVRGVGEVLADGSLKLSLRIGAGGAWAEALGTAGMLSEAKKDGDYRILKTDPLVVEGNWREPDFVNLWRLLAEGLGLAPE